MPTTSNPESIPQRTLTHLGIFLSGFIPGLREGPGLRFADKGALPFGLAPCEIMDLGFGSLQSGQRVASVGTSTWHLGHFIGFPHDAVWSTLAVRGPAAPRAAAPRFREQYRAFL